MKAIAAMDANRVIGNKGRIPWHLPEDFKWFKKFTWGKTLLMGRVTFESLPPLPHRDIVVLSNTILNKIEYHVLFREKCRHLYLRDRNDFNYMDFPDAIVAGGAKTYYNFLPLCSEVYMTHVMDEYEGDCEMPSFEHMFPNQEIVSEHKDFWVVKYSR